MFKKTVVRVAVFSLLAVSFVLFYQAEAVEGLKIGYVDIGEVLGRYAKTEETEKGLEKEQEERQKKIDEMAEEIKNLEKDLEAKAPMLKEEERSRRAEIINEKKKEHRRLFREYDLEIKSKVRAEQRELFKEIQEAVRSYGQEKDYTLILDGRTVLYGIKALDLTDDIVQILNKPKKSSK